MQSWTIKNYIKSQYPVVIGGLFAIVLIGLFLFQTVENDHVVWFCISMQLVVYILMLSIDYLRKKNFYTSLMNYKIEDVLDSSDNFEEAKVMKGAASKFYKHNLDEIQSLQNSQREYVEYIESWVHEIKTPIAAAKLMVENSGDMKVMDELSNIDEYVEQAMFYAKSSDVSKDYLLKSYHLESLVKECIRKNKRYFMLSKVGVGIVDCNEEILTDEKWMLFILNQIVQNAIKYSSEGSAIDFTCIKHHSAVELQIRDYGVGIELEDLPRIFEKGFTGKNGRDVDMHATGLGLYLAKRLCMAMHHEIRVSSTVGNTVFSIWFPIEIERLEVESYKTVR